MGQRCNLFVLQDGVVDVHYDHWAANRLDRELFWGPDLAMEFVRGSDPVIEGARVGEISGEALLDEVWAEGGALIDPGARRLVWFGGEDILHDLHEHLVHLDLMRRAWRGWRVQWAAEGMTTFARALRIPECHVITRGIEGVGRLAMPSTEDGEILDPLLATAEAPGGTIGAMLSGECEGLAHHPATPEALIALIGASPHAPFALAEPVSGIHLDVSGRVLECWSLREQPRLSSFLADRWIGWTTTLWGNDPSEHARRRPDLPWPTVTDADRLRLLDRLERATRREPHDPVGEALGLASAMRASGNRVEVNPAILEGRPSSGAGDRKRAVIAALRGEIARGSS